MYVYVSFTVFVSLIKYIVDEQVEEHRSKKAALRHALSYAHSIREGVAHFYTQHLACHLCHTLLT